jgi:hypothetical protein
MILPSFWITIEPTDEVLKLEKPFQILKESSLDQVEVSLIIFLLLVQL